MLSDSSCNIDNMFLFFLQHIYFCLCAWENLQILLFVQMIFLHQFFKRTYSPANVLTRDNTMYSQFLDKALNFLSGNDETIKESNDMSCSLCPVVASFRLSGNGVIDTVKCVCYYNVMVSLSHGSVSFPIQQWMFLIVQVFNMTSHISNVVCSYLFIAVTWFNTIFYGALSHNCILDFQNFFRFVKLLWLETLGLICKSCSRLFPVVVPHRNFYPMSEYDFNDFTSCSIATGKKSWGVSFLWCIWPDIHCKPKEQDQRACVRQ